MKHTNKGFTLIELLVVIAIIALISSIVFASISSARNKANVAKAEVQAKEINKAIELGRLSRGSLPVNVDPVSIKSIVESGSASELKSDIQEYYSGDVPEIATSVSSDDSNDYIYLSDGDTATDGDYIYLCGPGDPETVQADGSVIFFENKESEWYLTEDDVAEGWSQDTWYEHPKLGNTLYMIVDTPGGFTDTLSMDFPSFARTWGQAGTFDFGATRRVMTPLWSPVEDGAYATNDTYSFSCVK